MIQSIFDQPIAFLRVNEVGTGYGPQADYLDAEVIVKFHNDPRAFGLRLKTDAKLPAAEAMLALLEDAFNTKAPVSIDFEVRPGCNNHYIMRVIRHT